MKSRSCWICLRQARPLFQFENQKFEVQLCTECQQPKSNQTEVLRRLRSIRYKNFDSSTLDCNPIAIFDLRL